jgi:hypothetical protein
MQFTIGVTILECSFVKHSHSTLGVKVGKWDVNWKTDSTVTNGETIQLIN